IETVGPSVEPVQLQVACAKLWDDLPPDVHTITSAHIETYGDVDKALKRFYDDALSAAVTKTGGSKDRLRLGVDRSLITPGGAVSEGATGGGKSRAARKGQPQTPPLTFWRRSPSYAPKRAPAANVGTS